MRVKNHFSRVSRARPSHQQPRAVVMMRGYVVTRGAKLIKGNYLVYVITTPCSDPADIALYYFTPGYLCHLFITTSQW